MASSHSAVLLLLAPASPAYLRRLYPQCLLLNDGGIGGEAREKLGHRIALRMLLSGGGKAEGAVAYPRRGLEPLSSPLGFLSALACSD